VAAAAAGRPAATAANHLTWCSADQAVAAGKVGRIGDLGVGAAGHQVELLSRTDETIVTYHGQTSNFPAHPIPAGELHPSAIPAGLAQLAHADPLGDAEAGHLLAYPAAVPDPRVPTGRRHPLVAILALAAAAVLTGARSMAAVAEWAADAPQPVRAALGARRRAPDHWVVPSEATIRRTLARLDAEVMARVIGAWLADRNGPDQRRRAIAVDGKTLRGAKREGRQVHLLAAMEHATRRVLAQREVGGAPGEVPGFQPLLAHLDLAGAVVTADAL
jgi:hypothetical protein